MRGTINDHTLAGAAARRMALRRRRPQDRGADRAPRLEPTGPTQRSKDGQLRAHELGSAGRVLSRQPRRRERQLGRPDPHLGTLAPIQGPHGGQNRTTITVLGGI